MNIEVYNYRKKEFVTTSEWDAVEFLWKQTLMGDSGDNIVGVPNIGEKKSTKLLSFCENEEQLINTVLHKYIEYYGKIKGVANFNCLIIDLENGSDFVDALKVKANNLKEFHEIGETIKKEGKPYKYIAILNPYLSLTSPKYSDILSILSFLL